MVYYPSILMLITEKKKKKKKKKKSHTHSKYGQHLWGKRGANINVLTIDFTVLILTYQNKWIVQGN